VVVPSEHASVHFHPQCILEVRRVLLQHLVEQNRIRARSIPQLPYTARVGKKLSSESHKAMQLPYENQDVFK
jgi:hypothetical protein